MTTDPGATHFYGDGCAEAHGSWANMEQMLAAERALADDLRQRIARLEDANTRNEHTIVRRGERLEAERALADDLATTGAALAGAVDGEVCQCRQRDCPDRDLMNELLGNFGAAAARHQEARGR